MTRYIIILIFIALIYYLTKLLIINSPSNSSITKNKVIPEIYTINSDDTKKRLKDDVQMLAGTIGTRSVFHPDKLKQAKDYIKARLQEFGEVKEHAYLYNGIEMVNLELDIFGGPSSNPIIIFGAHYDTVSSTPGADDNASGVAVLLELARQTSRLKKEQRLKENIRFLAFTLEEPPTFNTANMGSNRYIKILKKEGKKVKGMICLEMVGYKKSTPKSQEIPFPLNLRNYPRTGDFIAFVANMASVKFLKQLILCTEYIDTLPYEKLVVPGKGRLFSVSRLSDHISFWDNGYPAVMVTDTAFLRNPNYHGNQDRPETLDYAFMTQLVQTLILLL